MANCLHCLEPIMRKPAQRGRPFKYCSKSCAKRANNLRARQQAEERGVLCSEDACEDYVYAKALCRLHYKRTRPRTPDPIETVTCDACGTDYDRPKRWTHKYNGSFCSNLCRDYTLYGPLSKAIPATHWARIYGATCEWVAPRMPRAYQCEWCGVQTESLQESARYCSRPCKRKHGKVKRRGLEHGATGSYTWMDITRLWVLFGRACAYCTTSTPLAEIQAEHVTALARGGANNLTNLLPSCSTCNSDKRDLSLEEWSRDRERRGLPPVITTWSQSDRRYTHLVQTGQLVSAA